MEVTGVTLRTLPVLVYLPWCVCVLSLPFPENHVNVIRGWVASTDNILTKRGDSSGQETDITADQRGHGKDIKMSGLCEWFHVQRFSYMLLSMLYHSLCECIDYIGTLCLLSFLKWLSCCRHQTNKSTLTKIWICFIVILYFVDKVKTIPCFLNVYLEARDLPEAEYQKQNFWIIWKDTDNEYHIL